ncbi:hypothetical protein EGS24_06630 [Salmonella enterica]|uniref:DUF1364 family protein n=8 Tax=Salmonella enterica TaxID=28901 RepID=A0A622CZ40_SALER|nr:hypothetical protein [Salmonella enterica]EAA3241798.1 hypothetical protein [Salmonella enterica subsp. enterica serovar Virchow]EAA3602119.1 hypothetical protein [Salmonella enterica subsp. enterica serovar Schwarzengrund]EAA4135808.1 hypothetical protein [Salmonella enterica subsp. enterica serovar Newport]EAA4685929.1 hypothetical protein [Salmonella enterica subsp. enterica serovar Hull]EAA7638657.1 hypothetical protein [Salmonella enterica subsp. enterica]EAB6236951.1 hypothetical pro
MEICLMRIFRSNRWLQAVREIDCCVLCGRYGVQAAHRNEGKGIGLKVDDSLTAALCPSCHERIDNGKDLSREERRSEMDRAIVLTLQKLTREGRVTVR